MMLRKRTIGILLLCCGFLLTTAGFALGRPALIGAGAGPKAPDWANRLIRLHIVANSDSAEDQALKRAVRDAILDEMTPLFAGATSIDEARARLQSAMPQMEEAALRTIAAWGKVYTVEANLGLASFPAKAYGSLLLPAGEYMALKIRIGEAKGANWWCVLWPPLCFSDWSTGIVREPKPGSGGTETVTVSRKELVLADDEEFERAEVKADFAVVKWFKSLTGTPRNPGESTETLTERSAKPAANAPTTIKETSTPTVTKSAASAKSSKDTRWADDDLLLRHQGRKSEALQHEIRTALVP